MRNDIKLRLEGGNLESELHFEIYKNESYVGNVGDFLGSSEDMIKLDAIAEQMAFEREVRIKFYAYYDFVLSKENIETNQLTLEQIKEDLFMFGISSNGIDEVMERFFK